MKAITLTILSLLLIFAPLVAQRGSENNVTIASGVLLNEAVQIMDYFCMRETGKRLMNMSSFNSAIMIPINNLPWRTALEMISLKHNLVIEDNAGFIAIRDVSRAEAETAIEASLGDSKQVRIKAVALVADRAYMRTLGIDWSTLLNGSVNIGVDFLGASSVPGNIFNITGSRSTTWNGNQIEVNTLIRTIESNQKGTIIAQPVIVVNSGSKGFIQVGQDISVKSVDDAGNTTDTFFATGVIMDVTPTVVNVDGQELVHLILSIERSSGSPGTVSTVINRSKSTTELVLYDGEETVIAGLYDTDEIRNRGGIPILKDLPWWVFGIRYLTGYTSYEKKERELLILIKAEIVENALNRANRAREALSRIQENTIIPTP